MINRKGWLELRLPSMASLLKKTDGSWYVVGFLVMVACFYFLVFLNNGLGLAYNDARSHLDIGRRVVEGLKPGLAQLGSVWLPLPHMLMVPTIWNDWMWHSGMSGALVSMVSFVATGVLVYKYLEELRVGMLGRLFGVVVLAANMNVLYLQATAMTELLLLATMTAGAYYLLLWFKDEKILNLIKTAFLVMMATLVRYDGWFMLFFVTMLVGGYTWKKRGWKTAEGMLILLLTLAALGVVLWVGWNWLIFDDPLYFMFGEFSAHAQQTQLEEAGNLQTKGNLWLSIKVYLIALVFNSYAWQVIAGTAGAIALWLNRKVKGKVRLASLVLIAPLLFNILALYLGHSVLFIQGISGNTWFNVRYGIMLAPTIAIMMGYLVERVKDLKWVIIGLTLFVSFFALVNQDAVTIDDARVGSSQKNVAEVSGWLKNNAAKQEGFVLISAASHDAIIFSSGMPMKRFIHEGTGPYWDSATSAPDRWARWLIMRTYDENDLVFKAVNKTDALEKYTLVDSFPFADIYELKPEYVDQLNTYIDVKRYKG